MAIWLLDYESRHGTKECNCLTLTLTLDSHIECKWVRFVQYGNDHYPKQVLKFTLQGNTDSRSHWQRVIELFSCFLLFASLTTKNTFFSQELLNSHKSDSVKRRVAISHCNHTTCKVNYVDWIWGNTNTERVYETIILIHEWVQWIELHVWHAWSRRECTDAVMHQSYGLITNGRWESQK